MIYNDVEEGKEEDDEQLQICELVEPRVEILVYQNSDAGEKGFSDIQDKIEEKFGRFFVSSCEDELEEIGDNDEEDRKSCFSDAFHTWYGMKFPKDVICQFTMDLNSNEIEMF